MWGNKLGWGISGMIVLFAGFMYYMLLQLLAPTPATAFAAKGMEPIVIPVQPSSVVSSMTDTSDSGPLYQEAIQAYKSNKSAYEKVAKAKAYETATAKLPAIAAVLKATNSTKADIFKPNPSSVINFRARKEDLVALFDLAKVIEVQGLLAKKNNPKEAQKYFEATFSLGYKMCQERLIHREYFRGVNLMGGAIRMLSGMASDKTRSGELLAMEAALVDHYKNKVKPVFDVINSIADPTIARHQGDVMKLAKESPEQMWRVEAILKLGRTKFNAPRSGDQKLAAATVRRMAESETDPIIKTAVLAARDMSSDDYQLMVAPESE